MSYGAGGREEGVSWMRRETSSSSSSKKQGSNSSNSKQRRGRGTDKRRAGAFLQR